MLLTEKDVFVGKLKSASDAIGWARYFIGEDQQDVSKKGNGECIYCGHNGCRGNVI